MMQQQTYQGQMHPGAGQVGQTLRLPPSNAATPFGHQSMSQQNVQATQPTTSTSQFQLPSTVPTQSQWTGNQSGPVSMPQASANAYQTGFPQQTTIQQQTGISQSPPDHRPLGMANRSFSENVSTPYQTSSHPTGPQPSGLLPGQTPPATHTVHQNAANNQNPFPEYSWQSGSNQQGGQQTQASSSIPTYQPQQPISSPQQPDHGQRRQPQAQSQQTPQAPQPPPRSNVINDQMSALTLAPPTQQSLDFTDESNATSSVVTETVRTHEVGVLEIPLQKSQSRQIDGGVNGQVYTVQPSWSRIVVKDFSNKYYHMFAAGCIPVLGAGMFLKHAKAVRDQLEWKITAQAGGPNGTTDHVINPQAILQWAKDVYFSACMLHSDSSAHPTNAEVWTDFMQNELRLAVFVLGGDKALVRHIAVAPTCPLDMLVGGLVSTNCEGVDYQLRSYNNNGRHVAVCTVGEVTKPVRAPIMVFRFKMKPEMSN